MEIPAGTASAAKLGGGDSAGALKDWKAFLGAHGKQLGNDGALQAGQCSCESRSSSPPPTSWARRTRSLLRARRRPRLHPLTALEAAYKTATKSGKAVKVKVVKLQPYQKFKAGTKEITLSLSASQLQTQIDQAKGDLDSMSEMGEMESLRLQMAMDRMSKMMSTLSNILKKISDTAQSITQNLK
ncbi:MAG: hypothetical protein U0263_39125 [Polyangiaceae bacterium]